MTQSTVNTQTFTDPDGSEIVGTAGIELIYRPKGFSLVFVPPIGDPNESFRYLAFKMKRRFGGD